MGLILMEWSLLGLLSLFSCGAADVTRQGPVFVLEPPNKIDFSNSTGTVVECAARGSPPPRVVWVHGDGQPVHDVTGLRQVFPNGTMKFLVFRAEDYRQEIHAQVYRCVANNSEGSVVSWDVHVRAVNPLSLIEVFEARLLEPGISTHLKCAATGDPTPEITWFIDETKTISRDRFQVSHSRSSSGAVVSYLNVTNILTNDGGLFKCQATSKMGSVEHQARIDVRGVPYVKPMKKMSVVAGQTLMKTCPVAGYPIDSITWEMNGRVLPSNARQKVFPNGTLFVSNVQRLPDQGAYTCVARNSHSYMARANLEVVVMEKPEVPFAIKVLNKSGRSVKLSWTAPYDGNSEIFRYAIEYKKAKGEWDATTERVLIPGKMQIASVLDLRPATAYQMRIIAENEAGPSEPSEVVTFVTSEEPPAGPPTDVVIAPLDRGLLVTWKPPQDHLLNGEVLGYYVGHRLASSFLFQTFEFTNEASCTHQVSITKLEEFSEYEVVVQAFNGQGSGPQSAEQRQFTAEGAPSAPPQEITCRTLASDSIRASWTPPPADTTNGIISGYKVIYGPSQTWYDDSTIDIAKSTSTESLLTGLRKYTEYNITVLAYTGGGDGPRSRSAICRTEEDVPEPPADIKALAMSSDSILVSWREPANPNGIIKRYTVYFKEEGSCEPQMHRVTPFQQSYRASGLKRTQNYQFWVKAETSMGEGPASETVTVTPRSQVPARIASFDDKHVLNLQQDVKLPCQAVGFPQPTISWQVDGKPFKQDDRMRILPEGSLQIRSVQRSDRGEYLCIAKNQFGLDFVFYQLIVQAPPYPPEVLLIGSSNNSIEVRLKPNADDSVPLYGFTMHYKAAFGEWQTTQVPKKARSFTVDNLWCGTKHQIYATAFNWVGPSEQSAILTTRTKGPPTMPEADRFMRVQARSVELHLNTWKDEGCPILYFVVEHRKRFETEWTTVSNSLKPQGSFTVLDLEPATFYDLRVTAHNNAGSTPAEYLFATLDEEGGGPDS